VAPEEVESGSGIAGQGVADHQDVGEGLQVTRIVKGGGGLQAVVYEPAQGQGPQAGFDRHLPHHRGAHLYADVGQQHQGEDGQVRVFELVDCSGHLPGGLHGGPAGPPGLDLSDEAGEPQAVGRLQVPV